MALSDVKVLDLEIRADKAKAGAKDFDAATDSVTRSAGKAEAATGKLGKSMLAGFGGAAIFAGVSKALSLFSDLLGSAIQEAAQGEAVYRQLEAAVRSTGGAAGKSAGQLSDMATQLQRTSTFADDVIMGAEGILLAFTRIKGENFDRTLQSVLDISERTGSGLSEMAKKIGAALNDPANAMRGLRTLGISLSASQREVLKELVATGNAAKAQAIILAALEGRYGGAAAAGRDTFAGAMKAVKNEANDLLEVLGQAVVPVLKVLALELAQNGPQWVRWATMAGKAIGAVVSAAAILAGAVVSSFGQVLQAFSALFQRFAVFFGIIGKIPALRSAVGAVGDLGEEIEALGKSVGGAGAAALGALLAPLPKLGAESRKAAGGLKDLADEADAVAAVFKEKLPESVEEYVRRVNNALAMLKAGPKSALTFAIKFDEAGAKAALARAKAMIFSVQRELLDQQGAAIRVEQTLGLITNDQAASKLRLLEVEYALNEAKALGLGITNAEADAFRRQAEEREKANKKWGAVVSALDSVSQLLGGSNTKIGQMVKLAADLAEAFRQIKTNVKGSQEAMAGWSGAIQAASGIMQAAGIGTAKGGPTQFGGKGEGNYAAQGALWGSVIGGIIGSFIPVIGTAIGAALGGMIGGVVGSFIKSGADEALGNLVGDLTISVTKAEGGLGQAMNEMSRKIHIGVTSILDAIGASLDGLPSISFKIRDGVISVFSNGIKARFQSMDDAVLFAVAEILKNGQLSGLTEVMKTVLQNTKAVNLDELVRDLDFARFYENLGLDDVAISMQETLHKFASFVRQATELGLDIAPLGAWLGKQFQAMRDQLLGIKKDPKEKLKADIEAYNQQLKIIRAEQEARRADILFKRAMLEAELAIAKAQLELERGHLLAKGDLLAGEALIVSETFHLVQALGVALAAMNAALAGVDAVLASLPDLINDDELKKALAALGRGGSGGNGGRSDARTTAQGLIDDAARNRMPDWAGQLFDLQKKFGDAAKPLLPNDRAAKLKRQMDNETDPKKLEELEKKFRAAMRAAGLNADMLDKLNKARLDEINLLRQQVKDQYAPYLKNWGKSDFRSGISGFLADLKAIPNELLTPWEKALIKARFLKEQTHDVTDRIKQFGGGLFPNAEINEVRATANGLRDDLAALAKQGVDVASRLKLVAEAEKYRLQQIEFGLVDTLFGYLKGSAEWAAQSVEFEKQKVALQFAVIEAQLRSLGVWAKYEGLFNAAFKAAMDAAGQVVAPTGGSNFESTVNTFADAIKEATDRWRNATRQIADFYRGLMFGNQSPLTGMQTVEAALAAYQSTASLARGGNLGAREQFTTVAQTLLDVLDRAYGSTEFSARLRAQVAADSQNLLGQTSFNDNGLNVAVSWTAVDRSVQDGTRRLVEAVQQAQASQAQGNGATTAAVVNLAQALLASNSNATDPELVAALQRIAVLLEAEARRNAA